MRRDADGLDENGLLKDTFFRWKIKWRLEHLGAQGIMGETAPLNILIKTEKMVMACTMIVLEY